MGGEPVYGNRAGQQKGGGTGGGTTSNMMDPIPITNMMGGGGGRGSHPYHQHDGLGEKVRAGNYHQHDGSHPYHQNDGWGGEGEQSFFLQVSNMGGGWGTMNPIPITNMRTTTNPISNMMGGGGNGNRGTEQVLSYHQHDGAYPYHQHDGWGGNQFMGTEQVSKRGGEQGGNHHQPYHQHDGWGGNGNRAGQQQGGGNRGGNYQQHDGSYPYHQHDGWGGNGDPIPMGTGTGELRRSGGGTTTNMMDPIPITKMMCGGEREQVFFCRSATWGGWGTGNRGGTTTNPITNMMGGGEREQGNRAGLWEQSRSAKGGGTTTNPITNMMGGGGTGTEQVGNKGGNRGGGNYQQHDGSYPYHQHDGWGGGRGSHPYHQHDGLGEKVRAGNYHQHDGSHPYHQNDGWGGGRGTEFFLQVSNMGGGWGTMNPIPITNMRTTTNPISNMMGGGGEREQGNRAGPILPPT